MAPRTNGDALALHRRMIEIDGERLAAWSAVETLYGLHGALAAIATAREPADVVAHMLAAIRDVLGFERAAYFTRAAAERRRPRADAPIAYVDEADGPPPELAWPLAAFVSNAPAAGDERELRAPVTDVRGRYVVAPLATAEGDLGVLYMDGLHANAPLGATLRLVGAVSAVSAAALQNGIAFARTRSLAARDPLTGLLNRRSFAVGLQRALGHAAGAGSACACVMLDLDDLKRINDTGGHALGDVVLKHLAATLSASARPSDLVARLGGDEFGVAFVCVDADLARSLVRRLSASLASAGLRCSLGAALSTAQRSDADALLAAADTALYAVKSAGKNGYAFAD